MKVDYKFIGKRVKASRLNRHLTQEELAEKTGVSDVFISYIETGLRRPSFDTIIKIARTLDVLIDSLVNNDSLFRLPEGYRELYEILFDCDSMERASILEAAVERKMLLRARKLKYFGEKA